MQEKEQKISPIKQRILQFVDTLKISKRDFYAKIGVSRGTLEAKTGITEDVLAKFIATYKEVSIEWLITGTGEMIKRQEKSENEGVIAFLKSELERKDAEIAKLNKQIGALEADTPNAQPARQKRAITQK